MVFMFGGRKMGCNHGDRAAIFRRTIYEFTGFSLPSYLAKDFRVWTVDWLKVYNIPGLKTTNGGPTSWTTGSRMRPRNGWCLWTPATLYITFLFTFSCSF